MRAANTAEITLHLLRHGQTAANEQGLYCGATNLPLTAQGIAQLRELRRHIAYPTAQLYLHSGLLRAAQTLAILYAAPAATALAGLREINFGAFEMRAYQELKTNVAYKRWLAEADCAAPPGGESKPAFTQRVLAGLCNATALCRAQNAAQAVIVCHGGVIAVLMESLFPNQKNFYEWQPSFGRGYTVVLGGTASPATTQFTAI